LKPAPKAPKERLPAWYAKGFHRRRKMTHMRPPKSKREAAAFRKFIQRTSASFGIHPKSALKIILQDIKHYSFYGKWLSSEKMLKLVEQERGRINYPKSKEVGLTRLFNRFKSTNRVQLYAKMVDIPEEMAEKLFRRRAKSFEKEVERIQKLSRVPASPLSRVNAAEATFLAAQKKIALERDGKKLSDMALKGLLNQYRELKFYQGLLSG